MPTPARNVAQHRHKRVRPRYAAGATCPTRKAKKCTKNITYTQRICIHRILHKKNGAYHTIDSVVAVKRGGRGEWRVTARGGQGLASIAAWRRSCANRNSAGGAGGYNRPPATVVCTRQARRR